MDSLQLYLYKSLEVNDINIFNVRVGSKSLIPHRKSDIFIIRKLEDLEAQKDLTCRRNI